MTSAGEADRGFEPARAGCARAGCQLDDPAVLLTPPEDFSATNFIPPAPSAVDSARTELREAAIRGDVAEIKKFASRAQFINAQDGRPWL